MMKSDHTSDSTLNRVRSIITPLEWTVIVIGLAIPAVARIPGVFIEGWGWMGQYWSGGIGGWMLIEAANGIAVGAAWLACRCFRGRIAALYPVLLGYGFLFWAHASLDLASDAQAAVALLFIPVFAAIFSGIGSLLGVLHLKMRPRP